jgi:dipeptidyl-peptidase 4
MPHRLVLRLAPLAVLLLAALPGTAPAAAQGPDPEVPPPDENRTVLEFDVLFGDDPGGARPDDRRWSPDGTRLAYLWDDGDGPGESLWVMDVASEKATRWLAVDDLDLDSYAWMPGGDGFLLLAGGDLHHLGSASQEPRRLTRTEAEEEDPKVSPDGRSVAFVRDADLHLLDLETGTERALTTDGEPGEILNGVTDWVYWEEIWGRDSTGFWWSPGGDRIAYYRFDESPQGIYTLLDYLPLYPEVERQRHPKAGTANPKVTVGVLDLGTGRTTWLDTGDDEYVARVDWLPSGEQETDRVAVQTLNRDQTQLVLWSCDPASGDCSSLHTERKPTWVNLGDDYAFLPGGGFVWGSEQTGWRHLYLYDARGHLERQLTTGAWAVTSLDAVDPVSGWVTYTRHGNGPLGAARRVVERVKLDGSGRETVVDKPGWNAVEVAPVTGHWVHVFSTADRPETVGLHRRDGHHVHLPGRPAVYDPTVLPSWELFQLDGPDGQKVPARMLKPPGFEPRKPYPVVMYHYGCPASQTVVDRWDGRGRDLWHKMMAERGYVVLTVDNGTSVFFGKDGEDRAHRHMGAINLATQKAAAEWLKTQEWVDGDRIGIWGWSGGGSNTLGALLGSPGTWRAGVSGAPVTDWRLYDTIWTERYLDTPQDNPEGYRLSSPLFMADRLQDSLLIVHGTSDDNVHPQNTFVMAHALVEAGKPFEMAIYPGQDHSIGDAAERHFYEKMTAFFDRELRTER